MPDNDDMEEVKRAVAGKSVSNKEGKAEIRRIGTSLRNLRNRPLHPNTIKFIERGKAIKKDVEEMEKTITAPSPLPTLEMFEKNRPLALPAPEEQRKMLPAPKKQEMIEDKTKALPYYEGKENLPAKYIPEFCPYCNANTLRYIKKDKLYCDSCGWSGSRKDMTLPVDPTPIALSGPTSKYSKYKDRFRPHMEKTGESVKGNFWKILVCIFGTIIILWFSLSQPNPVWGGLWTLVPVILILLLWLLTFKYGAWTGLAFLFFSVVIIFILGTGWAGIIGGTAGDIGETVPLEEATSSWGQISDMLENLWLMLTNPGEWYKITFVEKGERDKGATNRALELKSVEISPTEVYPGDKVTMVIKLENEGKFDARDVKVIGVIDKETINYDGKIEESPNGIEIVNIGTIRPEEPRLQFFTIQAPDCSDKTFHASAYVNYGYTVNATNNIEFYSREYYRELAEQNELKWKDELSICSAGPFMVTIRTTILQPIPDVKEDGAPNEFNIVLGIKNERDGDALIKNLRFYIPKQIEGGSCDDLNEIESDGAYRIFEFNYDEEKATSEPQTAVFSEYRNWSSGKCSVDDSNAWDCKLINSQCECKTCPEGMYQSGYLCISASTLYTVGKRQTKYFLCEDFYYTPAESEKIERIRTLDLKTTVDYSFYYGRKVSFKTRGDAFGKQKCSEMQSG